MNKDFLEEFVENPITIATISICLALVIVGGIFSLIK